MEEIHSQCTLFVPRLVRNIFFVFLRPKVHLLVWSFSLLSQVYFFLIFGKKIIINGTDIYPSPIDNQKRTNPVGLQYTKEESVDRIVKIIPQMKIICRDVYVCMQLRIMMMKQYHCFFRNPPKKFKNKKIAILIYV